MGLRSLLRRVPKTVALLDAAVAAMSGLVLPKRLIPENLDVLGPIVSLLIVVAFLMTLAYATGLQKRAKTFTLAALVALLALLAIQLTAVCPVTNYGPDRGTHSFLVGFSLSEAGRANRDALHATSCSELIQGAGDGRIRQMWNGSTVLSFAYALSYAAFVLGVVLALGGSDLAGRARSP